METYKSIEESIWSNMDDSPYEEYKLKNILNKDEIDEIRKGKWCCYWDKITHLWKWPEIVLSQQIYACKKYDCLWFVEKLAGFDENVTEYFKNILQKVFKGASVKPGVPNNEKWKKERHAYASERGIIIEEISHMIHLNAIKDTLNNLQNLAQFFTETSHNSSQLERIIGG